MKDKKKYIVSIKWTYVLIPFTQDEYIFNLAGLSSN